MRKRIAKEAPPAAPEFVTETVAIDTLRPHPRNYKKHPEKQLQHLVESLRENGVFKNVVVARDGTILAGHGVVEAARVAGIASVPVRRLDLDPGSPRALKIVVADNEIARLSETSDQELAALLGEIAKGDAIGLLGTGYDDNALAELRDSFEAESESVVGEDVVIDPPTEPVTKPGDVWVLGRHRLVCGDSTKPETFAALMGEERATMLWTDPPYNVDYAGKRKSKLTIQNDAMGDEAFRSFLVCAFRAIDGALSPGAVFYIAHADTEGFNFRGAIRDVGWKFAQCLIWAKDVFVMGRQDYHWRHEPMLYGWKLGAAHHAVEDRTQDTIWEYPRPKRSVEHPTMKPPELIERAVRNSTKSGAVVLDAFGGSGSTLVACEKTGRSARLVELDPRYCDVIVARWEGLTGQKANRAP